MPANSAGLLLYRWDDEGALQVLIAHMGGPFWARRPEEGAWTIVKGEIEDGEDPLAAALREFAEETGSQPPSSSSSSEMLSLGEVRQSSGKRVRAWAVEGDLDPESLRSNTFEMEWPPRSGRIAEFPEIDRVRWCEPESAKRLLVKAQAALIDELVERLGAAGSR